MTNLKLIITFIAILPPSLLAIILASCSKELAEDELRNQFNAHKTEMIQLKKMQLEDSHVITIAPTFTYLANNVSWPREDIGFSEDRWNKYRSLFNRSGVTNGISLQELPAKNDQILCFFVKHSSRGFAYTESTPEQVKTKLSECVFNSDLTRCFIPLEKNWYITIY